MEENIEIIGTQLSENELFVFIGCTVSCMYVFIFYDKICVTDRNTQLID